jgi:hypothetical protein
MLDTLAKLANQPATAETTGIVLLGYIVIAVIVAGVFLYFGYKVVTGG